MRKVLALAIALGLFGVLAAGTASANGAEREEYVFNTPECTGVAGGTGWCRERHGFAKNVTTPSGKVNSIWHATTTDYYYENHVLIRWVSNEIHQVNHGAPASPSTVSHHLVTQTFSNGCVRYTNVTVANGELKHLKESSEGC